MTNNKTLYIIRGLPGSGKSTLAHQLTPWVCEADDYFTDFAGNYQFDATKLQEAHKRCEFMCEAYMKFGYEKIAVSNTGSRRWEFAKYIELAQRNQYNVCEITLTGELHGSIHSVPAEAMAKMRLRWEP